MRLLCVAIGIAAVQIVEARTADQARFAARASAVVIDVSVTNDGRPVGGLTIDDFVVLDNGVPQTVLDLSQDRLPIDVSITADISGSMRPADRQIIHQAIEQIGRALRPDDRVMAALFWSHISERIALGPPPITLSAWDAGLNTSLFDALLLAPDRAPGSMDEVLKTVALQTGGELIALKDRQRLSETFGQALDNFRASYVLRDVPAGVSAPGWHAVTVSVKNRRHTVRARQGYIQPR